MEGETERQGESEKGDKGQGDWGTGRISMESGNESNTMIEGIDARVSPSPSHPVSSSPRLSVTLKWLARISRFFLAALFLFTAGAKLAIVNAFVESVGQLLSSSGFDYQRWSWPVTIGVIALEIIIALLLLLPRTTRVGAVLAAVLLMFFAGYALYYVYILKGEALECGCFGGIIASQLGVTTALRNLALLVPAVFVWFGYRRR
jgi:uncharacterized membrane protein YphA (DoxX/SURF4 family)